MMSNLEIVDRAFVEQFIATYEALFVKDNSEFTTYVDFSRLGAARLFALEARDPAARPPGRASDRRALDRRHPAPAARRTSQGRALQLRKGVSCRR